MEETENKRSPTNNPGIPGWIRLLFGFPLAALGVFVTAVTGLLLTAYVATRIGGGPREPRLLGTCFIWLLFGLGPLVAGMWLLKNSSKAPISAKGYSIILLLLAVLGADMFLGPKNWRGILRREKTVQADAATLPGTFVTPHLDTEIRPGTNLLWCGTFQLVWNETCARLGGDLRLVGPRVDSLIQSPVAAALNKHSFTRDCIDDASYILQAGLVKDRIYESIHRAVRDKFGFEPRLALDEDLTPRAQDFVAYACLWKKLSFPVPFERLDDSFKFQGRQVRAFGLGRTKASHDAMSPQVLVLDYRDKNDFVVQLKTTSAEDRLILAKVEPRGTLGEMVADVRERVQNCPGEPAGSNDVLIVPRMSFDILRKYSEIEGSWLVPIGRDAARDLFVVSALQSIRFEMNEKGVELLSEAHMALACGREREPDRPHIMIFDEPFLVMLERTEAPMPYCAFWLDNPQLMVPW